MNDQANSSSDPTPEMVERFEHRTREHIARVQNCLAVMAKATKHGRELLQRGREHDASKFSEEERIPYIWLTEYHRCRHSGQPFSYPPGMEEQVEAAIQHHMSANRHHPEYYANPNDMTDVDIIEMVCDWTAMAQEFGEPNGSARSWADKVVGHRVGFSSERAQFIYKTIFQLDMSMPTVMRPTMPMVAFLSRYSLIVEFVLVLNLAFYMLRNGSWPAEIKSDVIISLIIIFAILRFAVRSFGNVDFRTLQMSPLTKAQGIIIVITMLVFVALQMWLFEA